MSRRHPVGRSVLAVTGAILAFVVAPVVLVLAARRRFAAGSPLDGMDPPWRWTLDGARSWGRRLTGEIDTSGELIDLFLRAGLVIAWVCVAMLVLTIVREVSYQVRHGMPSSGQRNVLGIGTAARVIAGGLVALLPMVGGTPALAGAGALPPRSAAPAASAVIGLPGGSSETVGPRASGGPATKALSSASPAPLSVSRSGPVDAITGWSTYRVTQGDSVWSIAAQLGGNDAARAAAQIVAANHGRTMNDGRRFVTAALIEPGWELIVPTEPGAAGSDAHRDIRVPAEAARFDLPVHEDDVGDEHLVVGGNSYWQIAEDHLAEQLGREPTGRETYEYVEQLISFNAARLGHRDPAMIHPGEVVVYVDTPAAPASKAPVEPVVVAPASSEAAPVDVPVPADVLVSSMPVASPNQPTDPAPGAIAVVVVPVPADVAVSSMPVVPTNQPTGPASTASASVDGPAAGAENTVPPATGGTAHSDGVVAELGVGLGAMTSAGALGLLAARRRRRLRAAHVGARLAPPAAIDVTTERRLRSLSQPERLARIDLGLRAAALDIADAGGRVVTLVVAADGELRLTTDVGATPSREPWRLDIEHGAWLLPAGVTTDVLADAARLAGMACPALVQLGVTTDGCEVYVDLEALGVLSIDAPEAAASSIVRGLAVALTLSPFADSTYIVVVGTEAGALLGDTAAAVDRADTLDAALESAARALGSTAVVTEHVNTFALRARSNGGESWEPAIVFADVHEIDGPVAEGVGARLAAGRGLAAVVTAPVAGATWTLRWNARGCVLEPAGILLIPCGLSAEDADDLRQLLEAADGALEPDLDLGVFDGDRQPADVFTEPDWSVMVHVLGQVEATSPDGISAVFDRAKALELVAWLTQHREHSTRSRARTALWDLDVRDATFANVVSDARRGMARAFVPPAGEEWIRRTLTEELPLHRAVVTDAELLTLRVDHARSTRGMAAIDVLRPGLELVTGMPFAGTSYLWPDAEGITSSLTLLVIGAATQLANEYLALDDAEGVFWATGQGLKVLAGHEELIALRMRAHAGRGDLAGVRNEWEAYERALDADPWAASEPSPKLVAIRRELLTA